MAELGDKAGYALTLHQPHDLDALGQRPPAAARLEALLGHVLALDLAGATSSWSQQVQESTAQWQISALPTLLQDQTSTSSLRPRCASRKRRPATPSPGSPGVTPSRDVGVWGWLCDSGEVTGGVTCALTLSDGAPLCQSPDLFIPRVGLWWCYCSSKMLHMAAGRSSTPEHEEQKQCHSHAHSVPQSAQAARISLTHARTHTRARARAACSYQRACEGLLAPSSSSHFPQAAADALILSQ